MRDVYFLSIYAWIQQYEHYEFQYLSHEPKINIDLKGTLVEWQHIECNGFMDHKTIKSGA